MKYRNPYIESCLDGATSLFKGLNQKDKEIIDEHHTLINIKKGELLCKEGEKSRGVIYLASGKAKAYMVGLGEREQILKMQKTQDFIGFRTLFSENIWSLSVEAIEDSVICVLEKSPLNKILRKNPDISLKVVKLLADELWYQNKRIMSLTQKHVRGRLVESILILCDTYGFVDGSNTINVSVSRDDLSHLSNMTTSNAIRTLSSLNHEGYIKVKKRQITIINREALENISATG